MPQTGRTFATWCALLITALPLAAQTLADLTTPQPIPSGSLLVVGFLGGFDHWDDTRRGVRRVVLDLRSRGIFAEAVGNHQFHTALSFINQALDTNRDGKLDATEASSARVILFGQSWGGAAVVKAAGDLEKEGVPVLLTVQVDSVGLHDDVIPSNVRAAMNLFQHGLITIRGRQKIRAADPAQTRILGNLQFHYTPGSVDESEASWMRRTVGRSHAMMELDPRVWANVKDLILSAAAR